MESMPGDLVRMVGKLVLDVETRALRTTSKRLKSVLPLKELQNEKLCAFCKEPVTRMAPVTTLVQARICETCGNTVPCLRVAAIPAEAKLDIPTSWSVRAPAGGSLAQELEFRNPERMRRHALQLHLDIEQYGIFHNVKKRRRL